MQVLVVYGSQYGNTQLVAQAIGAALSGEHDVRVVHADEARIPDDEHVDLLFVGAPTQMRGLRVLARSFLDSLDVRRMAGVAAAAFDTRMVDVTADHVASDLIARRLRAVGCRTLVMPESFVVTGLRGPLAPGESDRAAAWARSVAAAADGRALVRAGGTAVTPVE